MKNQYPLCICKRTMKMLTKIILSGYFAIVTFNNFSIGVKVSSNVDLDSNEETIALDNTTFDTIVNLKKSANPPESILHASKSTFWHGSELIRASEPRKRRIYPSHDDSAKQPKIINNIQVVVNNDSIPNENSCEHGICNVTVSSKQDEKGNIVTEVHLSIITRAKLNKIDDVPVITGFRGVNEDHAKQPIFHSINSSRLRHTHLHRDNIPQFTSSGREATMIYDTAIQTNYQGYGEPWYGRTFRRPQIYWHYHHFGSHGNAGFQGHKTWLRDKPIVDDKIEPPLSKTKPNDDT